MARDTSMEHLHPVFRDKTRKLIEKLSEESLPFRLFEGYRTPQRQKDLYAQGRTHPGSIVTKAKPWSSYHQYGVAGDFVLFIDGDWSWDDSGERKKWWVRLHELARGVGLEPLSWETPHLQVQNLTIDGLRAGHYPQGGDEEWGDNLENAIHSWSGSPAAPPAPATTPARPALEVGLSGHEAADVHAHEGLSKYRVIARRGLRLREGPGIMFDVVDNLQCGQTVTVISVTGDWCRVDVEGDGLTDGYCHGGYLVRMD